MVTNPPFSLFREYVAQLMEYKKEFLILGNKNAITYKEMFSFFRNSELWIGVTPMSREIYFDVTQEFIEDSLAKKKDRTIVMRNGKYMARSPSIWYTNLDHKKRHEDLILYKKYSVEEYPKYDNYDAIDVGKTELIPEDYDGVMGVPITFLDKYNPQQFEILNSNDYRLSENVPYKEHGLIKDKDGAINGKPTYARILIRRRQENH